MEDFLGTAGPNSPNSPLHATLLGFRESLKRRLRLTAFSLVTTNDVKGSIKKLHGSEAFPYGYFRFPNIELDTDMGINMKQRTRQAAAYLVDQSNNSEVTKEYAFPVKLNVQAFYRTNDIKQAADFVQRLLILSAGRSFDFGIEIDGLSSWNVDIRLEGGVQIPDTSELDDEGKAGILEIPMTFSVKSHISTSKKVPKINNLGELQIGMEVGDGRV